LNKKVVSAGILTAFLLMLLLTLNGTGISISSTFNSSGTVSDNSTGAMESGPETNLPWQNEARFIQAQKDNNTPVLMAAYRTVLRDPLPGEEYNVHLAANMLAGTVIKPGQIFSQNQTVGPYIESRGFQKGPTYIGSKLTTTVGGGVCKIASTLYNVTVLSNLQVVERHNHTMPVPYVPYGQDATVAYGVKDFRFKNNTSFPVMIWAQGIDNVLYIAFYGSAVPPKIEWHHETLERKKAPVTFVDNPNLPAGTEKVILEGMDGAFIKSWITIENPDGTKVEKQMYKSYYNPMPSIIERSKGR